MKKVIMLSFVLIFGLLNYAQAANRVNASITPGKLCTQSDKDYWRTFNDNGQDIHICNRNVQMSTKYAILKKYGIKKSKRKQYKIDHLIPLNIGGSNHITNLFPINKGQMNVYERPEWPIYQAYRNGLISQYEATEFVKNWKMNFWNKDWIYANEYDLIQYEKEFPSPY